MSSYAPLQRTMITEPDQKSDSNAGNDASNTQLNLSSTPLPQDVHPSTHSVLQKSCTRMEDEMHTKAAPPKILRSTKIRANHYEPNSPMHSLTKQSQFNTIHNIEKLHDAQLQNTKLNYHDNDDETLVTTNSSAESTIHTQSTLDSKIYDEPASFISPSTQQQEWIPVKHNKRKNPITAEAPAEKPPSIKELIKKRGESQIDSITNLLTPVKIEFLMSGKTDLNIRNEFITVFNAMKKVDITLAVVTDKKVWYNSDDFPVDEEFMELFSVTQKNQNRTARAVMMFLTISSKMPINNIKFHPTAWAIINQRKVFVHPDRFDRQDTACPGYLINLHPRLV